MFDPRKSSRHRAADWPFAGQSIAGFWALNFGQYALLTLLAGQQRQLFNWHRLTPFIAGIAVTLLLWRGLRASARLGMAARLVVAALASFPAAVLVTTFSVAVEYLFDPASAVVGPDGEAVRAELISRAPALIADGSFDTFFFFFAWSAFYVAVTSGQRMLSAEARAAEFERLAQSSQLQALRYQINPHFLFNTLNSLSALVMTGRGEEAEAMILGLSDFFRSTLTTDPSADLTLAEEIALQRLYLDIERIRFPDRLRVKIDVPENLAKARVPALLLQPVVENAIKYGVAPARTPVTIRISADRAGGRMILLIQNSAGAAGAEGLAATTAPVDAGTGTGLANVRQRLAVRFGPAADCSYGRLPGGGFRVSMTLPLEFGPQELR